MIRALIVEDNRTFVQLLEFAIKKTFPNHFEEFEYEVVRCYNDATQKIQENYDIVFLDHNMPMDEIPEMRDWKEYSKHCRGIGYTLIPRIRRDHPGTAIIGTSSSSDLSHYSNPDHNLSKIDFDLAESLEKLLVEMQN